MRHTLARLVAVVSLTLAVAVTPDGDDPATTRYAWGTHAFEYPVGWRVVEVYVPSRGGVGFGPYVSNVRLGAFPVAVSLGPGEALAQWWVISTPGFDFEKQPGTEERIAGGRTVRTHVRPAEARCAADGGTTSIDIAVAYGAESHTRVLHACIDGTPTSSVAAEVRRVALSIRWPA